MKKIIHFLLAFIVLTAQSCETDMPVTDDITPEFTFNISGDGLEHTFNQDTDFSSIELNLKHDAEYDFILSSNDNGGVKLTQWQLPGDDYIEFDTAIPSPWGVTHVSALNKIIKWQGNVNSPFTGNILTGTFESNGENISVSFRFLVSDFGGESGDSNTISKELIIYIGDHDTEIVLL